MSIPRAALPSLALAALVLVAPVLAAPVPAPPNNGAVSASAQSSSERFYRAWYLEHAEGRSEAALELYRAVANDRSAPAELRAKAVTAAEGLLEDFAALDLGGLMPPDTILYAEIARPGEHLSALIDQLGLLGAAGELPRSFAISPRLLHAALGLRGAAVAVTRLDDEGEPTGGVLVLHPGDHELARGIVETAVPAGGAAQAPIEGFPVWRLEEGFAMLTRRLVVFATDRGELEGVARRLEGRGGSSLALASPLREVLPQADRALVSFYLRAEPVRPWISRALNEAARHDPEVASARLLLDPESLESVSGSLAVEPDGLRLSLALALSEGHKSLAFHLLRLPPIGEETLRRVPEGVAVALAAALNAPAAVAPPSEDGRGRPVVTAMDFGREIFANVVDVALFVLPSQASAVGPIPPVVASVRVNDVARSRALWRFVLALAGGPDADADFEPERVSLGGHEAERWICQGVPIYLVTRENELLISPSRDALDLALVSRERGRTLLADTGMRQALGDFGEQGGSSSLALFVHAGRALDLQRPREDDEESRRLAELSKALARTTLVVGLEQSETRLALHARLREVPDLSGVMRTALGLWQPPTEGADALAEHTPAPAAGAEAAGSR